MGRTAACDVKCQKQRQYKVQNIQPEYVKAQDSTVRIEKDRDEQRPCKESQKRGGQKCVGRIFQEKPGGDGIQQHREKDQFHVFPGRLVYRTEQPYCRGIARPLIEKVGQRAQYKTEEKTNPDIFL